jgi:cytosine/adenosine deaminase-related metal-dependent hydrolase
MDERRREIPHGGMFVRDGFIEQVSETNDLPQQADEIVDLTGHVVLPGLINAHHHLNQSLDRAYPASQNGNLVQWMKALYPRWEKAGPEDEAIAAEIGLAEIALSGCTTVADHRYLWRGLGAADLFETANKIGIRFHLGRGSQNIGQAQGGFAPPALVEDEDVILAHTEEVIEAFHDGSPGSFRQVFVAPNSVRTATPRLLRESAKLAARTGACFHMHLGETQSETEFIRDRFGKSPVQFAEELGCLTPRTWVAHGVHFNAEDVGILCRCGCGICHCPSSNMRLGSGVAPVKQYIDSGLTVGLGVDGSASNDSSNLLAEMRTALLLSRVRALGDDDLLTARTVLEMATTNGARLLGRNDIGRLTPGCVADFIAFDTNRIEIIGSEDAVAAIVFCALTRVDHAWVHGNQLIRFGRFVSFDLSDLIERWKERALKCR